MPYPEYKPSFKDFVILIGIGILLLLSPIVIVLLIFLALLS